MAEPGDGLQLVLACPQCGHHLWQVPLQLAPGAPLSLERSQTAPDFKALVEPTSAPGPAPPRDKSASLQSAWEQHRERFMHPCQNGCGRQTHRRFKLCPSCRKSGLRLAPEREAESVSPRPVPTSSLPLCFCPKPSKPACQLKAPLGIWLAPEGPFACRLFERERAEPGSSESG